MMRCFFLLLCFAVSLCAAAQKKISVVYESAFDADASTSLRRINILLAANDSVSFLTTVLAGGKNIPLKVPLGSKFMSHNQYFHPAKNLTLTQSHPMNRPKYLVVDTVKKLAWMLAEGEKEILGYACKKVAAQDGNRTFIAWYAPELPFSIGPNGFGGLPGVILELSDVSARHTQKAIRVEHDAPEIIEPTDGKKITTDEFHKVLANLQR